MDFPLDGGARSLYDLTKSVDCVALYMGRDGKWTSCQWHRDVRCQMSICQMADANSSRENGKVLTTLHDL